MSNSTEQRKLAAILFTDMVRDSALALYSVPQGRPTIAQRFIAGSRRPERDKPRRGDRMFRVQVHANRLRRLLSPLRGFGASAPFPSVETLGYSLAPSGLATAGPTGV